MYVPGPMRCENNLGFDYTSKHCIHKPRCLHCGLQGHNYDACKTKNTGTASGVLTAVAATKQWTKHVQSTSRCATDFGLSKNCRHQLAPDLYITR